MKGVDDVIENIQPFQTYSACLAQAIKDVQENMNL